MKQMAKKMFKGCPYEKKNFSNCSVCPNYDWCIEERRKFIERIIAIAFIAIICLQVVSILLMCRILLTQQVQEESKVPNAIEESGETIPKEEPEEIIPKAELSANGPSKVYYYNISDEEKLMMAKLVWAEARGECYEGKVAVAAVVLNRYRFDNNPYDFDNDSISSIILQKNQFASISNATMQDLEEYPDCMLAVEDACKGWDPTRATFENGALYFYEPNLVEGKEKEIREGLRVMPIGNHNFHYDFEKVN